MNLVEQFKKAFAITKKDLLVYYLKGPVIISGLLIPSFMFISFIFGRELSTDLLIPSLFSMGLFFTVSSISPMIAPWETKMKTFERLVSAPIALWAIILGDVIASFLFGLIITFFIMLISVLFVGISIINLNLIIGTLLAAFCFSSMGLLISAIPTDTPSNIMMISSLIKFPLIFISGVFVPISEMGGFKVVSFFSPLTYYTDLIRNSVQGISYFTPIINISMLLVFSTLFFSIAVISHKKTLAKRF